MANGETGTRLGDRAIVIGAGMGGMMSAQVLSQFFDTVLLFEKDTLPEAYDPRKSVPQGELFFRVGHLVESSEVLARPDIEQRITALITPHAVH